MTEPLTPETEQTECGAPHPYAGRPCTRPVGHPASWHGNGDRAWYTEADYAPQPDAIGGDQ